MAERLTDEHGDEERFAATVDAVRAGHADPSSLVALLGEQHAVYNGKSANAVRRMRGYLLATFELTGLPAAARPYVIEELETGRSPYVVAAAAKALRGAPDVAGNTELAALLHRAASNVELVDDAVSFDSYWPGWPSTTSTTALQELRHTLTCCATAAAPSSCCTAPEAPSSCCTAPEAPSSCRAADEGPSPQRWPALAGRIPDVMVEDQAGVGCGLHALLDGRPAAITFFYTRCDNPNKCSLTITKLGRLQHAAARRGLTGHVRLLAVTYDPAYDTAPRLATYGTNRGVAFDDDTRLLRVPDSFDALQRFLDLGVGHGPASPNAHRRELFVLAADGSVDREFTRIDWEPDDIAQRLATLTQTTRTDPPKPSDSAPDELRLVLRRR